MSIYLLKNWEWPGNKAEYLYSQGHILSLCTSVIVPIDVTISKL